MILITKTSLAMNKQMFLFGGLLLLTSIVMRAQPVRHSGFFSAVQSVKLSTGVNLQYVEQGDALGVPVILLHGFTDSWHSWELVLPYLPASLHVYALSQRGHGDSDKPTGDYDPQDFAGDVAAFMDAMKIKTALIVGHSMGSVIAQKFAIDYPGKTTGLVLVGSFANFKDNEAIQGFQQVLDTLNDPIEEKFALEFQQSTLANPIPEAFLHTVVQESLKVPSRVWKTTAYALFKAGYVTTLAPYTKPALIIWGDKDLLSPRKDQELLVQTMRRSQLLVYTGAGHGVHWEEPARFAADLVRFAQQITPIQ
jgi:non-heme chloroperoxidase